MSLRFDLLPTAWLFRAGHRIRLSLAGADEESFEPNPDGPRAAAGTEAATPDITWHLHRGATQTFLLLPWVR